MKNDEPVKQIISAHPGYHAVRLASFYEERKYLIEYWPVIGWAVSPEDLADPEPVICSGQSIGENEIIGPVIGPDGLFVCDGEKHSDLSRWFTVCSLKADGYEEVDPKPLPVPPAKAAADDEMRGSVFRPAPAKRGRPRKIA